MFMTVIFLVKQDHTVLTPVLNYFTIDKKTLVKSVDLFLNI